MTNEGSGDVADVTLRERAGGQKLFGRYTLVKILGRGGMGIVWLARDEKLEREVALKFLPEVIIHDRALLNELKRETRRSLDLTHKNIVRIYDFVDNETSGCISMEYIDGDTLSNLRAQKEHKVFEPDEIAAWTSQLCDALDYAHNQARIVHRDLKPANLMVNQKGDLKVSDFGIARSLGDSMSKLTTPGGTSGTLVYMSPQQLEGERGTHLDDVYSLGASVYDLLTSKPPFYSGNIDRQIHERVAPLMTERRKELDIEPALVPAVWEEVVAACLAKDPRQRPQSTAEIATRLQLDAPRRGWARPMTSTRPRKKVLVVLGIATLFAIGLAGLYFGVLQRQRKPLTAPAAQIASLPATIPEKSIAVLPFENRSEDKGNAYFADGIQDEILTRLAKIGDLKVISRTSTEKYRSRPDNLKKVAEELGVSTLLEGSVQKAGGKVRVVVQLIEAMSDRHLWAETYDRSLDDILTVQSEIAAQVANALHASLTPQESVAVKSAPTRSQKAYDLFLRAEHFLRIGMQSDTLANLQKAIELYRQAVAEDTRFALAYARLSKAESYLRFTGGKPSDQERANAEKALALQPDLVQARLALAYCDFWGRLDYPSALEHLARAQALAPQSAEVLVALGAVYRRQLRFDEAIAAYERAAQYDPGNSKLFSSLATTYLWAGRNDKVQPNLERALTLDPTNVIAADLLGYFLFRQRGDVEGARRVFRAGGPSMQLELAFTYWATRDYEKAVQLIEELPADSDAFEPSNGGSKDEQLGLALHWAGHNERARSLLEPARDRLIALLADKTLSPPAVMVNSMNLAQIELALGNGDAAVQVAERGAQSDAVTRDTLRREYYRSDLAAIYALAGRNDEAIALISGLLKARSGFAGITPVMLRLAPTWDPLREDSRFQALLKEYPPEGDEKVGKQ